MVGLIEEDPVGPAGSGPQLVNMRQEGLPKERAVLQRDSEQVDHHILIRSVQDFHDLLENRRRLFIA